MERLRNAVAGFLGSPAAEEEDREMTVPTEQVANDLSLEEHIKLVT